MDDEIVTTGGGLPATAAQMNVTASGNAAAFGIINGDVKLTLTDEQVTMLAHILGPQQPLAQLVPEKPQISHLVEWNSLNKDCFNVFVINNENYDCGSFSVSRRVALEIATAEEYRERFKPLTDPMIQEILGMPCLFAIKNTDFMKTEDFYAAFLGRLTRIVKQDENIRFSFVSFKDFRQQFINDNIKAFSKDIHRGFGSADIDAAVRSILMVEMSKRDRENRWVKTIKSNFDESDYTPVKLVLDDERRLSFEEMDSDNSSTSDGSEGSDSAHYHRPVTKIERAIIILETLLADGPVPVSEINEIMAEDGIGSKTAQRAKTRLGAVQEYVDGVPVWLLAD